MDGLNSDLASPKERLARLLAGHPRLLDVEHIEQEGLAMFAGALAPGPGRCGRQRRQESLRGRSPRDLALAEDKNGTIDGKNLWSFTREGLIEFTNDTK